MTTTLVLGLCAFVGFSCGLVISIVWWFTIRDLLLTRPRPTVRRRHAVPAFLSDGRPVRSS